MSLSSIKRVQADLDRFGLGIKVIQFAQSTATAEEAAAAAGCPLGAIVKSLVFMADIQPVLVLVAGDHTADQKKLAEFLGVSKKKVRIADAETVLQATGFAVGGVSALGLLHPLTTLIDQSLVRFETVWVAAGAHNAVFPIPFQALVQVTGAPVIDLVK